MDQNTRDVERAILEAVQKSGEESPDRVREQLVERGYSAREVRTAVAKLWDEGRLNFGADKKLRIA